MRCDYLTVRIPGDGNCFYSAAGVYKHICRTHSQNEFFVAENVRRIVEPLSCRDVVNLGLVLRSETVAFGNSSRMEAVQKNYEGENAIGGIDMYESMSSQEFWSEMGFAGVFAYGPALVAAAELNHTVFIIYTSWDGVLSEGRPYVVGPDAENNFKRCYLLLSGGAGIAPHYDLLLPKSGGNAGGPITRLPANPMPQVVAGLSGETWRKIWFAPPPRSAKDNTGWTLRKGGAWVTDPTAESAQQLAAAQIDGVKAASMLTAAFASRAHGAPSTLHQNPFGCLASVRRGEWGGEIEGDGGGVL